MISVRWSKDGWTVERIEALQQLITRFGTWLRFSPSTWLLKSNSNSGEIQGDINKWKESGVDEVILFEVNRATRAGFTEKWVWDWTIED